MIYIFSKLRPNSLTKAHKMKNEYGSGPILQDDKKNCSWIKTIFKKKKKKKVRVKIHETSFSL